MVLPWEPGWWGSLAWGSVSDQITAATAVITAILVVRQLSGLRDDRKRADETLRAQTAQSRSEAESARANLLLRIDEQFESAGVFDSRARWIELRAVLLRQHAAIVQPAQLREDFVRDAMVARLNDLWDRLQNHDDPAAFAGDLRDYNLLVRLPNWIETIGMIARDDLVPLRDIVRLYEGVVRMTIGPVEGHMSHRRKTYPASLAFENAIWLYTKITVP